LLLSDDDAPHVECVGAEQLDKGLDVESWQLEHEQAADEQHHVPERRDHRLEKE